MLHGYHVEFLCSVVFALAGLVHVTLMSICSHRRASSSSSALQVIAPPTRTIKKFRPVMAVAAVTALVNEKQRSLLLLPAFSVGSNDNNTTAKAKAMKGRPTRLVIPPPVVSAPGVNPFGEAAAGRETGAAAAAEVEVEGEGFCVASRRGVMHAMEDGYGVIADKAFYGVYDGHGGRAAVDLVAGKLGDNILAAVGAVTTTSGQQDGGGGVMAAIRAGFLTTDSEFLSQEARGGACAATALVKDGDLYIAHVGDCRAVLGTHGGVATALTSDHTPARADERLRVEASGGYVSRRDGGGVWRVQDCLAVSRAFGDADMRPWVSSEPEVSRHRLTHECAFLVLASDGLWGKVSNQEAVDAVKVAARSSSSTASESGGSVCCYSMAESCRELVDMARSRGSRDDITVMVVDLQRFFVHPSKRN